MPYYAQARNSGALVHVLTRLEDYAGLEQLLTTIPERAVELADVAHAFESAGLCEQAAAAYVKVSMPAALQSASTLELQPFVSPMQPAAHAPVSNMLPGLQCCRCPASRPTACQHGCMAESCALILDMLQHHAFR